MSVGITGSTTSPAAKRTRTAPKTTGVKPTVKTSVKPKTTTTTKPKPPAGNKGNTGGKNNPSAQNKPPVTPDFGYKWNLPPHRWSLPVNPSFMVDYDAKDLKANHVNVPDSYRRGRIWYWVNDPTMQNQVNADGTDPTKNADRKYGFQFMWNPESYSTSVSLNTDITPSFNDRFVQVAGAFPSGEMLSISLNLDRTNDFACAKRYIAKQYGIQAPPVGKHSTNNGGLDMAQVAGNLSLNDLLPYYNQNGTYGANYVSTDKIMDLLKYGTVADLEYLYKAINGPGWKNVAGRDTSDIGYLAATLVRVDLGPVAYVGYLNNLSVNHTRFSTDMTPISSQVSMSINLMASAGFQASGTGSSNH